MYACMYACMHACSRFSSPAKRNENILTLRSRRRECRIHPNLFEPASL
jgi:hypothetical protein